MSGFQLIKYIILIIVLIAASYTDIKERKIPNILVLIILAIAFGFMIINLDTVLMSVLGFSVAIVIFFMTYLFSKGGLGAGDVKLAAAVGLYVGLFEFINIMLYSLIYTVIVGAIFMIAKRESLKTQLPFAPFVLVGCITNIIYCFTI